MAARLPAGWQEIGVRLRPGHDGDAQRAAVLLGQLGPGLAGEELHLRVTAQGAAGPGVVRRLLARVDAQGIDGTLELTGDVSTAPERAAELPVRSLAASWDELESALPDDWSDLLCLVELRSSDELGPAALELAPLNPSRHGGTVGFRFRVARRFGYGAAPEMARRCLARLDEAGIPGALRVLEAFSETRPVLTQGPTFVVSDRAV